MPRELRIGSLKSQLYDAEEELEAATRSIRDVLHELGKIPEEGPTIVGDGPAAYRSLVRACQWLILQEFPSRSNLSSEQRDLVQALEGCGERAGI